LKESLCSFDLEGRQELQRFGVINCYVKGIFSLLHAYCSTSRYVCQQFCQNFVKICLQIEVQTAKYGIKNRKQTCKTGAFVLK
jgi:hypothetical protein